MHVIAALLVFLLIPASLCRAAPSGRAIYRCERAGVITFSDRPCDPQSQAYELDASRISTYQPPAVTQPAADKSKRRSSAQRRRQAAPAVDDAAKQVADCREIRDALKAVHAKMRAGYGAGEGERLQQRRAKLLARSRLRKCR